MDNNIFTYANDFVGLTHGNVNERTGSFDFGVNLAEINANNLNGPELNLNLFIDPSSDRNYGFGAGISLGLPSIDLVNNIFHSINGASVKLDVTNRYPVEPTLQDFKILPISYNQYQVKYITGDVDYFRVDGRGEFACLVKRQNALGFSITLNWSVVGELLSIKDQANVEYFSSKPFNTVGRELSFFSDRYFISIIKNEWDYFIYLPYETAENQSDLAYQVKTGYEDKTGKKVIKEVLLPDGTVHELIYGQYLNIPSGGNFAQLPAVTQHTIKKANEIVKQVEYDFLLEGPLGKNAYGFGANIPYKNYSDTLYRVNSPYFYKTKKIVTNHNGVETSTIQTYDKFHNLIEVLRECEDCTKTETFEYFANYSLDVGGQGNKFKLVKMQEIKYSNGEEESTSRINYNYDNYGNLLYEHDEFKKIKLEYEYYDTINGSEEGCPKYEFIRFLKSQKNIDIKTSESRVVSCRKYKSLVKKLPDAIFISEDKNQYSDVLTKYDYYIEGEHLGRLRQQSLTHNDYEKKDKYDYIETDSSLEEIITHSYTSPLGDELTSKNRYDILSGATVEKAEQGNSVFFDYYFDGRLKRETTAADTSKESTLNYYYDDEKNCITTVDALGNEKKIEYDAMGQEINKWLTIPNVKADFLLVSNKYNQLGQLISKKEFDTSLNSSHPIPIQQKKWALTTQYQYDNWGELESIVLPDGQVQLQMFEPTINVTTSGIKGLAYTKKTIDEVERTITETHFDGDNNRLDTGYVLDYNGFGLSIKLVTDLGVTTKFEYDVLDRELKRIESSDDVEGNIITATEYSPYHSTSEFITSISVNGYKLGSREYDGYGRLIKETIGSSETLYNYENEELNYNQIVLPNGKKILVSFDKELGEYTDIGIVQSVLDKKTGLPLELHRKDNNNTISYQYRFDGVIIKETSEQVENQYEYTLDGSILSSSFGQTDFESVQYDDFQRVVVKQDALNTAVYEDYDEFSRVTKITITGENQSTMEFDYSCFPDQVVTTIIQGNDKLIETINFARNGKVESKITNLNGSILDESYTYNSFGQLTTYLAVGLRSPKDQYGNTIRNQAFTYDSFGNVSTVTTDFTDNTVDNAVFTYAMDNPTRLHTVSHSHPDYTNLDFSNAYDDWGNLLRDEKGFSYSFNQYGEMQAVYDENNVEVSRYTYDAQGRLVTQSIIGQPDLEYIHSDNYLVSQKQGDFKMFSSIIEGKLVGKKLTGGGVNIVNSYLVDSANTPLKVNKHGDVRDSSEYIYTPYGYRTEI